MRHFLIIIGMLIMSLSWLIWLCRAVDPSRRYSSKVEYNYARYCSGCHGAFGEGNGRIGRFKRLAPADLTKTELWADRNDAQMIHSINAGKGDMPAFSVYLTIPDQKELLAFVKANFRPETTK